MTLKNITLSLNKGEMLTVMGPVGCGKVCYDCPMETLVHVVFVCTDYLVDGTDQRNGSYRGEFECIWHSSLCLTESMGVHGHHHGQHSVWQ